MNWLFVNFQVRILSIGFPAREQRCPIIYDHTALRFNDFRKDGQESCNLSSRASWILMFGELYASYHRQLSKISIKRRSFPNPFECSLLKWIRARRRYFCSSLFKLSSYINKLRLRYRVDSWSREIIKLRRSLFLKTLFVWSSGEVTVALFCLSAFEFFKLYRQSSAKSIIFYKL